MGSVSDQGYLGTEESARIAPTRVNGEKNTRNMKVSIIIVTWNSRQEVENCLRSLNELNNVPCILDTVVIDNASTDGTVDFLRENQEQWKGIGFKAEFNKSNMGLSLATARAFTIAQGEWVLLCNPDITFTEGFVSMLSFAATHSQFPILTVEMVNSDGSTQRVVIRRFPTVARVFFDFSIVGTHVDRYVLGHFFRDDYCYGRTAFPEPVARVDQPGASFLLLSRDSILKVGGIFSNEFPIWWNDVDLAMRAEKAGIPRVILSRVRVPHGLGHSSKKASKSPQRYLFCQSMARYARKWKMHLKIVQTLFLFDAVFGFLVNFLVWQKRMGIRRAGHEAINFGASQARGVLNP